MSVDELRRALDAAEARTKWWGSAEDVAFWMCMLCSGAVFSDHLWLRAIAALSLAAWVLTAVMRSRASRADLRAHMLWSNAFYGRGEQ